MVAGQRVVVVSCVVVVVIALGWALHPDVGDDHREPSSVAEQRPSCGCGSGKPSDPATTSRPRVSMDAAGDAARADAAPPATCGCGKHRRSLGDTGEEALLASAASSAACPVHGDSCPHVAAATAASNPAHGSQGSCPHSHHHHDHDHDHDHHHHHDEDEQDGQVPDWTAELKDATTGEVREVRAVLRRGGLSYFSPGNFRSALAHTVVLASTVAVVAGSPTPPTVLVLLYKPGSDLCDEAQPKYAALAEAVASVLNATSARQQQQQPGAFVTAVFRVDAFASEDEAESGGPGSGGDGADVIRESGGADLLHDVPAVVYFQPDPAAPTGIGMRRFTGTLDAKTVLLDLADFQHRGAGYATRQAAEHALDALLGTKETLAATSVGSFGRGVLDV